jgi:hypothetical protein
MFCGNLGHVSVLPCLYLTFKETLQKIRRHFTLVGPYYTLSGELLFGLY